MVVRGTYHVMRELRLSAYPPKAREGKEAGG